MSKAGKKSPKPAAPAEEGQDILQLVMSKPRRKQDGEADEERRIDGVVIGTYLGRNDAGICEVTYPGAPDGGPLAAISTQTPNDANRERPVALSFVEGDPGQPVILGFIQEAEQDMTATVDNDVLTLTADKQIVLQCGKSSITLTRAGKIIIKGAYLSNHSTGVNRIKGGSVQLN
jgi:hypothetical protein